jgi:hypothetical protein
MTISLEIYYKTSRIRAYLQIVSLLRGSGNTSRATTATATTEQAKEANKSSTQKLLN